jgi:hypothetical protein
MIAGFLSSPRMTSSKWSATPLLGSSHNPVYEHHRRAHGGVCLLAQLKLMLRDRRRGQNSARCREGVAEHPADGDSGLANEVDAVNQYAAPT